MTVLELAADSIGLELSPTGFNANIQQSIDKHPIQNADLAALVGLLTVRGVQSRRRNLNQSMDDRAIAICYDGLPTLQRRGTWGEIMNSDILRYFVTVGHNFELDDFEGDYELQNEDTVTDTDGVITIQYWKRTRLRI